MKSAGMVLLGLFAWGACFLGEVSTPLADTIQIAAPTFIMDPPYAGFSEIVDGTLRGSQGLFYAPVPFPPSGVAGQQVCGFTMFYANNRRGAVTARLVQKPIDLHGDPFAPPIVMASVTGVHGVDVREATTTEIVNPAIDAAKSFYFAELEFSVGESGRAGGTVLGVQIDVRPTCSPH